MTDDKQTNEGELDRRREAMMRAAALVDQANEERDAHLEIIEKMKVALEVKNNQITDLSDILSQERNRYASLQNERDLYLEEVMAYREFLANAKLDLEGLAAKFVRFELPEIRRGGKRTKRSGPGSRDIAGNGDAVLDGGAGPSEVAIGETVVAHLGSVLGQPTKE